MSAQTGLFSCEERKIIELFVIMDVNMVAEKPCRTSINTLFLKLGNQNLSMKTFIVI
jgi:hypothetical protein